MSLLLIFCNKQQKQFPERLCRAGKPLIKAILALCIAMLVAVSSLWSAEGKDVALVLKTAGKVQLTKKGRSTSFAARRGHRLNSGEVVRTGDNSLAALVFTDDRSLLKIRSNSDVTIQGERQNNTIVKRIKLAFGEIWAKVTKQKSSLRVEAPSGVATVKGTEFNCLVADDNFFVFCREGLVELVNQFGSMMIGANEMARLTQGAPPQRMDGNPDDIFELSGDDEGRTLEIEYEDEDGNKKKLILEFE